jgi:hypothetical protein
MGATSPAAAGSPHLSETEFRAVLEALATDFEVDDPFPLPEGLPARPLSAGEWQEIAEMLRFRPAWHDEGEAVLPSPDEPGSEAKVRELRRRFRERLALFSDRDRQLHNAISPGRALAKLGDALAAERHVEASARGKALAARARRNGVAE